MREIVMNRVMKRLKKEQKGFTLIELLAVIVILGIIAAIAVPLIGKVISKSGDDSDIATARQVYDAARLYITSENLGASGDKTIYIENIAASGSVKAIPGLQSEGYLSEDLILPSTKNAIAKGEVKFTSGALVYVHINAGTVAGVDNFYVSAADVIAGKGTKHKTAAEATTTTP